MLLARRNEDLKNVLRKSLEGMGGNGGKGKKVVKGKGKGKGREKAGKK